MIKKDLIRELRRLEMNLEHASQSRDPQVALRTCEGQLVNLRDLIRRVEHTLPVRPGWSGI